MSRAQLELLGLVAEYDRREAWRLDGATSMPAWLAMALGALESTAREQVRVGRAPDELPHPARAFGE